VSVSSYLESLPLNVVARRAGGPPKDVVAFTGCPQQHPVEKGKLILVYDPLGPNPALMEFNLEDLRYVEEVPQAVTAKGESIPLVRLWIRRGARAFLLEPFEVDDPIRFVQKNREVRDAFLAPAVP